MCVASTANSTLYFSDRAAGLLLLLPLVRCGMSRRDCLYLRAAYIHFKLNTYNYTARELASELAERIYQTLSSFIVE